MKRNREKMDAPENKVDVFCELALTIGSRMDLYEMLRDSLSGYVHKLDCIDGIVYQIKPGNKDSYYAENIFCIPYAIFAKGTFTEPESLKTFFSSKEELDAYRLSLPITGSIDSEHTFHIMDLEDFGLLVLVNKGKPFSKLTLQKLELINRKLAQTAINCVRFENLSESENRYRSQEELIGNSSGFWDWNMKKDEIFISESLCRMLGYNQWEIGQNLSVWKNLVHPADLALVSDKLQRHINGELPLPRDRTPDENQIG
ncbi:MAG: PAS domain-containing protein [Bacteroidetes bacterium]|nr:PAS domain-containing protein [Bacteroidota bacterium]